MRFVVVSAQVVLNGERLYAESQVDREDWVNDWPVVSEHVHGLLKHKLVDMILERLSPAFTVRVPEESLSDLLDRAGAEEWAGMTDAERRAAYGL